MTWWPAPVAMETVPHKLQATFRGHSTRKHLRRARELRSWRDSVDLNNSNKISIPEQMKKQTLRQDRDRRPNQRGQEEDWHDGEKAQAGKGDGGAKTARGRLPGTNKPKKADGHENCQTLKSESTSSRCLTPGSQSDSLLPNGHSLMLMEMVCSTWTNFKYCKFSAGEHWF